MYQSLFLDFRHPLKPDFDALGVRGHEAYIRRLHKALNDELNPSGYEVRKWQIARQVYTDYEEFGLPYAGGSYEQPRWWKRALNCVLKARQDARWEIAQAEAEEQAQDEPEY